MFKPRMEEKKYACVTCRTVRGSNIIFAEYAANLKIDLVTAKEIVANRLEFTENKEHYVILDLSNIKRVPSEVKAYMQQPDGGLKNILGAAFLANNLLSALIANIFIKTPKHFEAKFFHCKDEALNWIKECMQRNGHTPFV